jgi:hypothetical protein
MEISAAAGPLSIQFGLACLQEGAANFKVIKLDF